MMSRRVSHHPQQRSPRTRASLLLCALAWALGLPAAAQNPETTPINMPEDLDPNGNSGWLKIEVAVLIDDRREILESEFWPPFPEPRYPQNSRWLIDLQKVAGIRSGYPLATAQQDERGAITLTLPDPLTILAEAQAEFDAAQAAINGEVGTAAAPSADEPTTSDDAPAPIPLELIDAAPQGTRASVDWLRDFEKPDVTPPVDPDAVTLDDYVPEDVPLPEPALPVPFSVQPVDMLRSGLQSLVRNNPDRLALSTGWLQPPDAPNLPIVLDDSGDSEEWPPLQGFVELRRGNPLRLGVNFWWNTDAFYYPETFSMSPPPRGPKQIEVVDALNGVALAPAEAVERAEQLADIVEAWEAGRPVVEYVDPDTGFFIRKQPVENIDVADVEDPRAWPWRHVIQVADTRAVPEGAVRYFDHPVVKVVATWRELSWGEVYRLGDEQRQAREADATIEAAALAKDRASAVPPGDPKQQ